MLLYLSHPVTSCKILRRSSQGNPSLGVVKCNIERWWIYRRLQLIPMSRSGISSPDEFVEFECITLFAHIWTYNIIFSEGYVPYHILGKAQLLEKRSGPASLLVSLGCSTVQLPVKIYPHLQLCSEATRYRLLTSWYI